MTVAVPEASLPEVLLVGPRPAPPLTGGVEKGIDMLLRTDLARRTSMRCFNTHRLRDPRRPLHSRVRYQLGMLRSFRRELKRRPAGLVHVKTSSGINFHQNALYALCARSMGLPVLMQIHSGRFEEFYRQSPRPLRAWIRLTLSMVTAVAVLSEGWGDRISRITSSARIVVIPNGMETAEIASLSKTGERRQARGLFLGTGDPALNRDKGLEDLLEVLPGILVREPKSTWVLAGLHDPMAVRDLIERSLGAGMSIGDRVTCLPCVTGESRVSLFRECTFLVLPTHYENMPNLVLEAMAAGMGVVATEVGAIPEMLKPPEGGILIKPGDREGLANAVLRLLASPALVSEQGRRNLEAVTRDYALSVVERKLETVYREVGADKGARADYRSLTAAGGGETPRPAA